MTTKTLQTVGKASTELTEALAAYGQAMLKGDVRAAAKATTALRATVEALENYRRNFKVVA